MSLTDVAEGEVQAPVRRRGHGSGALTSGFRALFAAVSGLLLISGVGVVLWAVTPSSAGGPQQSVRAAVAAFAGGNLMTLTIGRAALTLPPLMITVVAIGLLVGLGGRGRAETDDRTGEVTRTLVAAAVYAAAVTIAGVVLGTPGAVAAEQWWRPFLLALVVVGATVVLRGQAWRALVLNRTPLWFPVAVRLGAVGAAGVLAAGAVAVVIGLTSSFGSASAVQNLAAPGPAAGFGMALLGIAYLPNAVVAGAGYATGVGFHIGSGTYSMFGSSPVELPAVSLLAAAPDGSQASRYGCALLLVPVVVAVLLGRAATRRLGLRRDRLAAVGAAAAFAGLFVAVLAAVAGGGVTGGQWASIGAPPLPFGVVTAIILGVFGAAVAGPARQSAAPASADAAGDPEGPPRSADPDDAADEHAGQAEPDAAADAEPDVQLEADQQGAAAARPDPAADVEAAADTHPAADTDMPAHPAADPATDTDIDAAADTDTTADTDMATDTGTDAAADAHMVPPARREADDPAASGARTDTEPGDHLRT